MKRVITAILAAALVSANCALVLPHVKSNAANNKGFKAVCINTPNDDIDPHFRL